jgi:hypothetical protein
VAAPAALAMLAAACRVAGPMSAIDPALSDSIPADASAVAGIDLKALRDSPLYPRLPAAARAFVESFGSSPYALQAYARGELLLAARGAPPGWTAAPHGVSLSGAPDLVQAAIAPHPRSTLIESAELLAARYPVWAVLRGGTVLPLTGNLANLNHLLRDAQTLKLGVRLNDRLSLELAADCATPDAAAHLESSIRALLSLAAAANVRQPEIAAVLRAAPVHHDNRNVRATIAITPEALAKLLPE